MESDPTLERYGSVKLSKVGNSFKITIPGDILELWGLNTVDDDLPEVFIYSDTRNEKDIRLVASLVPLTKSDKIRAARDFNETEVDKSTNAQSMAIIRGMLMNNNSIDINLLTSLTKEDLNYWKAKFYELIGTGRLQGQIQNNVFHSTDNNVDKVINTIKSVQI